MHRVVFVVLLVHFTNIPVMLILFALLIYQLGYGSEAGKLTADDKHRMGAILRKGVRRGVSQTDLDIDEIINSADRKLFSQITQPRHCLHHLLPPKTSAHCPYSLRKRQHNYQCYLILNIHSIKTVSSLVVYLTFDMTVMMISSSDDEFGY